MEAKQLKFVKGRAKVAIAALVVVTSIAAGSAVLAQDSTTKPATPEAMDKMVMDAGGGGMVGMGKDGNGMMGMMSGMQKMKCCGQGMAIPIMAQATSRTRRSSRCGPKYFASSSTRRPSAKVSSMARFDV